MNKFKLTDQFINKYKEIKPPFGFNGLGELVYLRTYSKLKLDGQNEQWFETVQRVVEGTFNMQKNWIEQHSLGWNPRKAQNSAQEMYDRIFNMKFLPPGRGLWAMGSPIIEERGLYMSLNNCFSYQTKILTRNGWTEIGSLQDKEIDVVTDHNKWVTAKIKSFGKQKLYKLNLIRQGVEKSIYTTIDHIWFAKSQSEVSHSKGWNKYKTSELKEGYRLRYGFVENPQNFSPQGVQHGICFGDGTKDHLYLIGEKDRELVQWFPNNVISDAPEKDAKRIVHLPEHFKDLPQICFDKKYLLGWLMGYFAADGSVDLNGQISLSSASKSHLVFAENVAALCGIGVYSLSLSSSSSNFSEERELYRLNFMPDTLWKSFFLIEKHRQNFVEEKVKRYWNVKSVEETDRNDDVFCAVVPETNSFVIEGNILTHNCGFTTTEHINEEGSKPFCFLMDASMLGVGIGFDTKGDGKIVIKGQDSSKETIFVIPDTREGWVESVKVLLESYFYHHPIIKFDYSQIRKEGERIKGFGGVSSGYKPLEQCHKDLINVLNKYIEKYITTTCIVDIMNLIGKCVVSGNLRRTAEIVFGDYNNQEYLDLKNYKKNPHRETYGWTSNNSIFADLGMKYKEPAQRTSINGEPGYAWIENMKNYSKMNNGPDGKDVRACGANPCNEQTLEHMELCCLCETFPNNHKTLEDYLITLKYAYLYAKTVTLGKTHWAETNRVMLRNRRIGCSMSGIAQFITKNGLHSLKQWCEEGYKAIEYYDTVYSDWLAIPKSIKKTSVKPSGCLSGDTVIQTENGDISLKEIFLINGVDIEDKELLNKNDLWFDCKESLFTKDIWGKLNKIVKLYWNGKKNAIKLDTDDRNSIKCSVEHKFLVKINKNEAVWKTTVEINIGDEIVKI